jgi:long-chain acyl-CoA synthetase
MITDLIRLAKDHSQRVGLYHKFRGEWYGFTFAQILREVKFFAHTLTALGFEAGDRLAVTGEVRPHLLFAFAAAEMLGGRVVAIDAVDRGDREGAVQMPPFRIAFIERRAHIDLLRSSCRAGAAPDIVIHDETHFADEERVVTYAQARRKGQQHLLLHPAAFSGWSARHRHGGAHSDVSETTVMTSSDRVFIEGPLGPAHRSLARHLWWAIGFSLICPAAANSAEGDRNEMRPTYLFGSGEYYEKLWQETTRRLPRRSSRSRVLVDRLSFPKGPANGRGNSLGGGLRALVGALLARRIRARMGLADVRGAIFEGAAPTADAVRFFAALGIRLQGRGRPDEASRKVTGDRLPQLIADFG